MIRLAIIAAALLFMAGCGGAGELEYERAAIDGNVTFGGEPVMDGRVRFIPTGETIGHPATAVVESGKYQLPLEKGPAVGTNRVEILAYRKTGETETIEDTGETVELKTQYLPTRFNMRSKQTIEIKPGENQHDFNLNL